MTRLLGRRSVVSGTNNLLSLLFRMARAYGLIQFSPVEPFLHRPSVVHKEKPTFPLEKGKDFLDALPAEWQPFVAVLSLTGMRQGELLGLRWQDVDFNARLIHKRNVVYKGKLVEGLKQTGKKKAGRLRKHQVGISPLLECVLKAHQENQETPFKSLRRERDAAGHALKPEDYVFCQDNGRPVNPDHFRRYVLYPALETAGIVEKTEEQRRRAGKGSGSWSPSSVRPTHVQTYSRE
jgi:integrase